MGWLLERTRSANSITVLTDTMTFPGKDGRRMKLWEKGADIGIQNSSWNGRRLDLQILAEPMTSSQTCLGCPALSSDYDAWWDRSANGERSSNAARAWKKGTAIEISSSFKYRRCLSQNRQGGRRKFCFGSNGRYPNMGKLEYSLSRMRRNLTEETGYVLPKNKCEPRIARIHE